MIKGLKEIKEKTARSPQKFSTTIYGKKIFFIILFTAGSTFAFEQAILGYNWQNALIYLFTIVMGLVMEPGELIFITIVVVASILTGIITMIFK